MKKGRKPNANEAQLRAAMHEGMDKTMVFCLTALADKMGFDHDKLVEFIGAVVSVADSVTKGYVKYADLHRVLVEEQGLEWQSQYHLNFAPPVKVLTASITE